MAVASLGVPQYQYVGPGGIGAERVNVEKAVAEYVGEEEQPGAQAGVMV